MFNIINEFRTYFTNRCTIKIIHYSDLIVDLLPFAIIRLDIYTYNIIKLNAIIINQYIMWCRQKTTRLNKNLFQNSQTSFETKQCL